MKNIPVQYAIQSRQVIFAVGGCFALIGAIVGIALWLKSPNVSIVMALVFTGAYIWMLVRNLNTVGEASIEDSAFVLVPHRRSLCSSPGVVTISWDDIDRVQVGATNAPNAPRMFVSLRTHRPKKRSWIITLLRAEDAEFLTILLDRANEARGRHGGEPLQAENPYGSAGWKIAAVVLLVIFFAAIIGTIVSGKADDIYVWARVITLGAFAVPFAMQVLGSKKT